MYLDYYGLKQKSFTLSPNPKFLYYSRSHKEALSRMIYAVSQDSGLMLLTGEVGTGKTILINQLLKYLPHHVANIQYTLVTPKGLVQNICLEFGIPIENLTTQELVFKLQEHLKRAYRKGEKSVLILDEAQNLSWDSLELVRLLSNMEAKHERIFQILFVGQPELTVKLDQKNLRQLWERISVSCRLGRFNRSETKNYIIHRLHVGGNKNGRELFMEAAIDKIFKYSAGIPRRINMLCENALLMGYVIDAKQIGPQIIENVELDKKMQSAPYEDKLIQTKTFSEISSSSRVIAEKSQKTTMSNPTSEKNNTKNQVPITGSNSHNYEKFQNMMSRILLNNRLLIIKKPKFFPILFVSFLYFLIFSVACFSAIFFAVKIGILK